MIAYRSGPGTPWLRHTPPVVTRLQSTGRADGTSGSWRLPGKRDVVGCSECDAAVRHTHMQRGKTEHAEERNLTRFWSKSVRPKCGVVGFVLLAAQSANLAEMAPHARKVFARCSGLCASGHDDSLTITVWEARSTNTSCP